MEVIMKTLSIRIPDDMMSALQVVSREEKIEASTAMRKLVRIGYESYVGNLYRQGKMTLREAAVLLDRNQMETLDLFLEAGISGNLDASDILISLETFK
jgi:predicted HTH domain antitoxin